MLQIFFIIIFCSMSDQVKRMVIILYIISNLQWNQVLQILQIWNNKKSTKVGVSQMIVEC